MQTMLNWFYQYAWQDVSMRYHLIAAIILTVLGLFSFGMTAFVPLATTTFTFHPTSVVENLKRFNGSSLGDNSLPMLILLAMSWGWAFPLAHGILTHTALNASPTWLRVLSYSALVWGTWLVQTLTLSFLFFRKNVL